MWMKFKDTFKIVNGFFKGSTATVIDELWDEYSHHVGYVVRIDGLQTLKFGFDEIKRLQCVHDLIKIKFEHTFSADEHQVRCSKCDEIISWEKISP